MFKNFSDRLKEKRSLIGTWVTIPSAELCEILGVSGLDFSIIDMEHGVFSLPCIGNCIRALNLTNTSALVRVSEINAASIQNVLDLGADGLVLPQVRSVQCVDKITECMYYSPKGSRGYNPFIRGENYGLKRISKEPYLAVIIENPEAFDNIESILEHPAVNLVYLGVYDMSVHLGCTGEVSHPLVREFVAKSVEKIKSSGKAVGLMTTDLNEVSLLREQGVDLIVYGTDSSIIMSHVKEVCEAKESTV